MTETKDKTLAAEIRRRIALAGPMPVSRFMELSLTLPGQGYYVTRDPLGRGGDFTTAPEISQMFGELIGLWSASTWKLMGQPERIKLIELGPGRGTMIADAMRAVRIVAPFVEAVEVHLVEINPILRARQAKTLDKAQIEATWHDALDRVPEGPAIILANEYFDALPIHQAIRRESGWHERTIEIGEDGALRFGYAEAPLRRFENLLTPNVRAAAPGSIFEWRDDESVMALARRLRDQGGAALIFDYGHVRTAVGDTFQAISRHAYADPLESPGNADLTAHVDFEALAEAALTVGAHVFGPSPQGEFLRNLGIENRALTLMSKAQNDTAENVASGLRRLISTDRDGMGALFKVIALANPSLSSLPALGEYVSPRRPKKRAPQAPAAAPAATPADADASTPASPDPSASETKSSTDETKPS